MLTRCKACEYLLIFWNYCYFYIFVYSTRSYAFNTDIKRPVLSQVYPTSCILLSWKGKTDKTAARGKVFFNLSWVVLNFSGKCRNQFFLSQIFIFHEGQKTKKSPASVYSLKSLTNAKIHIFNYVPHKK